MARTLNKLTERGSTALPEGNHSDRGNLFVRVRHVKQVKHLFWNFRYESPVTSRTREMGLGSYDVVSLKEARASALYHRKPLHNGLDKTRKSRPVTHLNF